MNAADYLLSREEAKENDPVSEQAQAERKTIVGVCEEVSEKNGWTTFAINVGSQYPVRLQTKLPALIEQGRAVGGQQATWNYKESQGNPNPNRPGTFYANRYLEGVEVGNSGATASSSPPVQERPAEAVHAPVAIGDKERTITRQTCIKAAAALYSGTPITDVTPGDVGRFSAMGPGAVIEAAARFEQWIYRDIDEVPF